jgi:4-hydroxy-2-oxoheptanedioate aldolase
MGLRDFRELESGAVERTVVGRLRAGVPVLALGGHDVIWIDLEHSTISVDDAAQICATALDVGLVPFVRIPEREYGVVGRLLDGGAVGIIAPRIETAAQARELVAACRFPPLGHRSAISTLPQVGYRKLAVNTLNEAMNRLTVLKVLIESPLGVENIGEIAAVTGVDFLGIGSNDLSAELGYPGDYQHPVVRGALLKALEVCQKTGKPLAIGGISDAVFSAELIRRGAAPFLMTGIDTDILLSAAQMRVKQALESINHQPNQ